MICFKISFEYSMPILIIAGKVVKPEKHFASLDIGCGMLYCIDGYTCFTTKTKIEVRGEIEFYIFDPEPLPDHVQNNITNLINKCVTQN